MLWPFNHFRKPRSPLRGTISFIYGMIVAQAREPVFYRELGVPDTVDARFDMVVLHLWLALRRLRAAGEASRLGQGLIDQFCSDMDDNLRELGVADLKVPKKMLAFSEAFYGRSAAYDAAMAADDAALAQALNKNIYSGQGGDHARDLARYVRSSEAGLAGIDTVAFMTGDWRFPSPASATTGDIA